jgi:hypothetical protein
MPADRALFECIDRQFTRYVAGVGFALSGHVLRVREIESVVLLALFPVVFLGETLSLPHWIGLAAIATSLCGQLSEPGNKRPPSPAERRSEEHKGSILLECAGRYAVWMLLTAILPVRRSSAVSKDTFWPSTRPRMPARSSAVAWTNTSLLPLSG